MHVQRLSVPRALLFDGTVGAGKTSVAIAAGEVLAEHRVPHAVIDLDSLGQMWPAPTGDPFNIGITLENLRMIAANYLAAKVEWLLVSGVVETRSDRDRYRQALGTGLQVCRLQANGSELSHRLRARHAEEPGAMEWHLNRAGELDGILDEAGVDDFGILTTGRSARVVSVDALTAAQRVPI